LPQPAKEHFVYGTTVPWSSEAPATPNPRGCTTWPALRLTRRLMAAGLLVVPAGEQTIRLLPPLNVSADECTEAIGILRDVLAQAQSRSGVPAA